MGLARGQFPASFRQSVPGPCSRPAAHPFGAGWGCSRTRQAPVPEGLPSVVGTVT